MADDHDNDHTSDLEERTLYKNVGTTPKDTPQVNDKNSPNKGDLEAFQSWLKQLEEDALRQREAEKDLQREIRRGRESENKLSKVEADVKTKASHPTPEDSTRKEQDPFTREIMKTRIPKDFKLPDMTLYDGTTDPTHHLKKLVREGRLDQYLATHEDEQRKRRKAEDVGPTMRSSQTPERHVHMIHDRLAGGEISKSSRERHLKDIYHVAEKKEASDIPAITFTKEDASSITSGHDDPMVITIILANANLHRTLIDQGSSADILFKTSFDKLGLEEKELRAYSDSLFGLGNTPVQPMGYIPLHTTFGKGSQSRTLKIDYIVVDISSAYNALIGRTMFN
ncbi:uncharacterized protein LOC130975189 [Arachis stenosperma]|uniref:uncharacterized protein LOC130975189 n=1 Tax=Arachis stenosperma TaxID=217475 RepID=UPI0025AD5AA7|nr:uncharacterized protein LOC130975189 [Arachis stenosperma]